MDLEPFLEKIREHYLAAYRRAIARYRERFQPSAAEVLLEIDRDTPPVYRYFRIDLASGATDPPNYTEVNHDTHLRFEAVHFDREGLAITLSPVVWNGIEFDIKPALQDDSTLQAWALAWIDPDERSPNDADGLGGYIHSVTVPKSDSESTYISIDFGSAPIGAVLELIELLSQAGARCIDMHSRTVLDSEEGP